MDGWDDGRIRAAIAQALAKQDWQLAEPPEEFFEAVVWELRLKHADADQLDATQVERVVKRCYSRVLYRASGASGTAAQTRAYEELRRYLSACAHYFLHDAQAEADTTQQALANIIARHADCADADTFLGWCRQIVVNYVREHYRKEVRADKSGAAVKYVRREIPIDALRGEGEDAESVPGGTDLASETDRILQEALRGPMYEALLKALWDCLEQVLKVRVIVEIFLNGKNVPQVAQELAVSATNIQMIKYRALQTLRDCGEMKLVFRDWNA